MPGKKDLQFVHNANEQLNNCFNTSLKQTVLKPSHRNESGRPSLYVHLHLSI